MLYWGNSHDNWKRAKFVGDFKLSHTIVVLTTQNWIIKFQCNIELSKCTQATASEHQPCTQSELCSFSSRDNKTWLTTDAVKGGRWVPTLIAIFVASQRLQANNGTRGVTAKFGGTMVRRSRKRQVIRGSGVWIESWFRGTKMSHKTAEEERL